MWTYFICEFEKPTSPTHGHPPVLLHQSTDLELMMIALHRLGTDAYNIREQSSFVMYEVAYKDFDYNTVSRISPNGIPAPGSGITPVAVHADGKAVFLDPNLETGFILLIDAVRHLPRPDYCSTIDRLALEARLSPPTGKKPDGTQKEALHQKGTGPSAGQTKSPPGSNDHKQSKFRR